MNNKILIVDDDPTLADLQMALFEIEGFDINKIEIANTIKEARLKILNKLDSFGIIVIDSMRPQYYYYSDSENSGSLEFINELRLSGFKGKIIAASTDYDFRVKQIISGCDFAFENKNEIPKRIKNIIGLN